MKTITKADIVAALQELGLQNGDHVLVHSAIQYLGRPEGGAGIYFDSICAVLGIPLPSSDAGLTSPPKPDGTLAVPTFNFGFGRGEPYDPQTTPSAGMGVLSEYIRQQPGVLRSPHPMQSLAVIGRWAEDLTSRDTPGAFDDGSAFERMLQLEFKILLLGADIDAVSMLHYSEQRTGVPYRYWKEFRGQVKTAKNPQQPGGWQERTYRMYVRDLKIDPRLTLQPVKALLRDQGRWFSLGLNYGHVSLLAMRDFVAAVDACLRDDPWALVTNRPAPSNT